MAATTGAMVRWIGPGAPSIGLGHVHRIAVGVPELEHQRCCWPIEKLANSRSEVRETGMSRTGITGEEADAGVDAGGNCVGSRDQDQRGPPTWQTHVDPAEVDIHVCVEPCLEAKLLEELLRGVLVRHGDA